MYKKQMVLQKLACFIAVAAAAISFVYSLGIMTDIYDGLFFFMPYPDKPEFDAVQGARIFYDMQPFNSNYVIYSIGLILAGCLLFITNTHSRRRYYISNFVATLVYSAASIGVAVWSHLQIEAFKTQFLTTVDFETYKIRAEMMKTPYIESTFWFDAHYFVCGIIILAVAALLVNMVLKMALMNGEKKLIQQGKEASV